MILQAKRGSDLSYSNFDSGKEVAIVSLFSDNSQYKFTKPWTIELQSGNKEIMEGTTYARRELANLIREEIELTQFEKNP